MGKKSDFSELETIAQDIEDDCKKYATNISKYMAQEIADEMTEVTQNAINDFYEQYDPEDLTIHNGRIYYYRHWNFQKSFRRHYINKSPSFSGGVELLKNEIPNVYRGKNSAPGIVFDRVYLGYHGIASFQDCNPEVPIMKPSPIKLIHERFRYINEHLNEYEEKAAQKARKDSYKRIKF